MKRTKQKHKNAVTDKQQSQGAAAVIGMIYLLATIACSVYDSRPSTTSLHPPIHRRRIAVAGSSLQRFEAGRRRDMPEAVVADGTEAPLLLAHVPVEAAGETAEPIAHLILVADLRDRVDARADQEPETRSMSRSTKAWRCEG